MTATYLYCVVKAPRKPSVARAPEGLPGAARPVAHEVAPTLWLIVADVPLDVYGGGNLERSLGDLEWVGRIALAHEAVVEHFATRRGLTVIPMKLFTLFSSTARAAADVKRRRTAIERAMKRISGAEEWGVRVFRDAATPQGASGAAVKPASGAAFLAAKKNVRDQARSARLMAAEAAVNAYDALARHAREARRRDDAPAAGTTPPLLNAAFLVPVAKRTLFTRAARREAEACAASGAQMTLSGPWPAYNFIEAGEQAT